MHIEFVKAVNMHLHGAPGKCDPFLVQKKCLIARQQRSGIRFIFVQNLIRLQVRC